MSARSPFLLSVAEPSAVVTGRTAAVLEREFNLAALRVRVRGKDPEVSAVLEAIREAATAWRGSAAGTEAAPEPELAARSSWVSSSEAGDLLGISGRAVVKAIHDQRLPAQQVAGRWRITREDVEHFKAGRAA